MPSTSPSDPGLEAIYKELRAGIRETDGISFKLLGLVPLVSGTALIAFIVEKVSLRPNLVLLFAVFAAAITLGLFRWELRNIQTCKWLIQYAYALELKTLRSDAIWIVQDLPEAPGGIGKTEAEKIIYTMTVLTWLALPLGLGAVPKLSAPAAVFYFVAAAAIGAVTVLSLLVSTRVDPIVAPPSAT